MDFIETGSEDMNCIILAQKRAQMKGLSKICNAGWDVNFMTEEKRDICERRIQTACQSRLFIREDKCELILWYI
jgi:hypothetical protein